MLLLACTVFGAGDLAWAEPQFSESSEAELSERKTSSPILPPSANDTNASDYSYRGIAQQSPLQFNMDTSSTAPSPASAQIASHIVADRVIAEGDSIVAEGNVAVVLEQARLMCDNLSLDRLSGNIVATGHCLLYWENNYVAADWLTYVPEQHIITVHNASGQAKDLGLSQTSNNEGLAFWAEKMTLSQEKTEMSNITLTTCDRPADDLHVKIKSEHLTVYHNDRVFADKTSLYIHGYHVITLPTINSNLAVDRRMERSFIPRIGNNSVDGLYVRTALPYILNKDNYGAVLLGYNTKTSVGLGLEHCYRFSNKGQGVAYYYRQGGRDKSQRYELRNNFYYNFDDENELTWDFKANQTEIPDETHYKHVTSNLNFRHRTERDTLLLSHNYSKNDQSSYNHNVRLYYNIKLTPELAALVNADLSSTTTSYSESSKFHYVAGLRHTSELFDTDLMLENTSGRSMYHLNRNPELSIRSHPLFIGDIPVIATASFGNVYEYPNDIHTTRTEVTVKVPNQIFDYGSGKLVGGAGVRQIFYGTGHSMYALAAQAGWMQNIGNFGTVRLDYNWMQPTGETPLQHDLYNGYSNLTGGVEFFDKDKFNFAVIGGYNLRSEKFQNITPRISYRPGDKWKFIVGSSFDPNNSQWRSLDSNVTLQVAPTLSLSHWSVYDLINNRFTYHDYQINYEAHDWLASIIYRGVQKEVYLQFSLKAFGLPPTEIGPDANRVILPRTLPNAFTMSKK